jgi:hypothetical protein
MLSKSGWIKEAMFEKLEREDNPQHYGEHVELQTEMQNNMPVSNLKSFLNFD